MPYFFGICGYKNSGKTTFITKLFNFLTKAGLKVSVVKSSSSKEVLTDSQGTDTWKYREAGAKCVGLFQGDFLTLFRKISWNRERELYSIFSSMFWDQDLVLFEGFKSFEMIPKVWMLKGNESTEEIQKVKKSLRNLEGVVAKKESLESLKDELNVKVFSAEDVSELGKFLLSKVKQKTKEVLVFVNGELIPLKEFVKDIIGEPILSAVKTLKGVPEEVKEVEVKIKIKY